MAKLFGWEFSRDKPANMNIGKKSAKRLTVDYGQSPMPLATDAATISLKKYLESDPDLASNVRRLVDNVLIEAPKVVPVPGEKIGATTVKNYNQQLKDVRFYKLMRAAIYSLIWNGNAFFEIKFNGNKLKEMYNIDPETIEIVKTPDGNEVAEYQQQVNGSPVVTFAPEEIIHLSIDNLDSGVWGNAFIKSLQSTLVRKDIAESYLQWLIQKNKFAPIINVKADDINEDLFKHIVSEINGGAVDPNYLQIVNMFPDDQFELIKIFTTDDFDRIQNYINEQKTQIMSLLQVPPIVAGNVDNSNRSNSEIQARLVFYNTLKALQNLINEELDYEMLRKLNWSKVQFAFPAVDQRSEVETIKIANSLKNDLNFTDDAIEEFLKENGFKIPKVAKLFEENMETDETVSKTTDSQNNTAPSREPRDKTGIPENEAQRLEDRKMGVSANAN